MTGVVVVLVALVVATIFGLWRAHRDGVVRRVAATPAQDDDRPLLSSDELGQELGARATLVQFSSAFCQPCRAARGTLSHVAGTVDGVEHVEVDTENNLHLVRRLGISRTPTTLVLDGRGHEVGRATGVPRPDDVRAALPVG